MAPQAAVVPSVTPSSAPSESPSSAPSETPSDSPTMLPLMAPQAAVVPSVTPSSAPSESPSSAPSEAPSGSPTMLPSMSLTASPSDFFLNTTSNPLSAIPSSQPSAFLSTAPSLIPSDFIAIQFSIVQLLAGFNSTRASVKHMRLALSSQYISNATQAVFVTTVAQVLNIQTSQVIIVSAEVVTGGLQIGYLINYYSSSSPDATSILTTLSPGGFFASQLAANAAAAADAGTRAAFAGVTLTAPIVQISIKITGTQHNEYARQ
jgi:hypothetical protein